jgi:hypothetical protein
MGASAYDVESVIGVENKEMITNIHRAVLVETQNALAALGVDFKGATTVASPDKQMKNLKINMCSDNVVDVDRDKDIPPDSFLSIYKDSKLEYEIWVKYTKVGTSLNVVVETNICSNNGIVI